jgi:hypothetical protein
MKRGVPCNRVRCRESEVRYSEDAAAANRPPESGKGHDSLSFPGCNVFAGIVAYAFYFRMTAKLQSIGESTPGLIWPNDVFKTFRKYRMLAGQNAWPLW